MCENVLNMAFSGLFFIPFFPELSSPCSADLFLCPFFFFVTLFLCAYQSVEANLTTYKCCAAKLEALRVPDLLGLYL